MIGGRGALMALVIVAAAACAGPGSAPKQRMPDGALALVDGEPIMEAELQETIVAFRAENRQTGGSGQIYISCN